MPRYIDADKLIAEQTVFVKDDEGFDMSVVLVSDIKRAPTADVVEVKHGEWKQARYTEANLYICSECDAPEYKKHRYCPNCGAIMDGKGDPE